MHVFENMRRVELLKLRVDLIMRHTKCCGKSFYSRASHGMLQVVSPRCVVLVGGGRTNSSVNNVLWRWYHGISGVSSQPGKGIVNSGDLTWSLFALSRLLHLRGRPRTGNARHEMRSE